VPDGIHLLRRLMSLRSTLRASLRTVVSLRSAAPGGSHPFQDPRATGVSPLLGVGRTRRRDTLVPHVSSDRRDSSPGQTNDPFPLFHRKQGKANVISSRFPAFLARWEHSVACPRMNVFPLSTRFLQVGRGVPALPRRIVLQRIVPTSPLWSSLPAFPRSP
jgi:hypothetical protein